MQVLAQLDIGTRRNRERWREGKEAEEWGYDDGGGCMHIQDWVRSFQSRKDLCTVLRYIGTKRLHLVSRIWIFEQVLQHGNGSEKLFTLA